MKSIGIRELRQNASAVLRAVEKGATVQVTDRNRPVALLTPIPDASPLEILRAAGEVEPSRGDVLDLPPPIRPPKKSPRPSAVLSRLRADER